MENAKQNPIEDQRKEALRHYDAAARIANHWSSFVRDAILAYNPQSSQEPSQPVRSAEEVFKELDLYEVVTDNDRVLKAMEAYASQFIGSKQ
jgi:hypothetical protein